MGCALLLLLLLLLLLRNDGHATQAFEKAVNQVKDQMGAVKLAFEEAYGAYISQHQQQRAGGGSR